MIRLFSLAAVLAIASYAHAAQIEIETTQDGAKIRWSITYLSEDGVMRIDEGDWVAAVTASASGSMESSSVQYTRGRIRDTIIYIPMSMRYSRLKATSAGFSQPIRSRRPAPAS